METILVRCTVLCLVHFVETARVHCTVLYRQEYCNLYLIQCDGPSDVVHANVLVPDVAHDALPPSPRLDSQPVREVLKAHVAHENVADAGRGAVPSHAANAGTSNSGQSSLRTIS